LSHWQEVVVAFSTEVIQLPSPVGVRFSFQAMARRRAFWIAVAPLFIAADLVMAHPLIEVAAG